MTIKQDPKALEKFQSYPPEIRKKLDHLRNLIVITAKEMQNIQELEETLKWGEPSYIAKKGTTIRIDWKAKTPEQYAMYFSCQTVMIPTIKELYGDLFLYEKDRAILFPIEQDLPEGALKDCIRMALEYHRVKGLPLLGR
ncbi:MAG: DUF1801 domain-containing protein [Bacteroidota bacterium]